MIGQSKPFKTLRLYSPTFLLPNFPAMQCINVNIQEFTVDYCISVYVVFVHCVRSWYKLPHEKGLKYTLKIHMFMICYILWVTT